MVGFREGGQGRLSPFMTLRKGCNGWFQRGGPRKAVTLHDFTEGVQWLVSERGAKEGCHPS